MKKYTIKELEEMTGDNIEEVMMDYIESCKRTSNYNMYDNVSYFMRENNLLNCERSKITDLMCQMWDN